MAEESIIQDINFKSVSPNVIGLVLFVRETIYLKYKFDGRKVKLLYDSLYNYILNDIHDVLIYLNNGIKVGVVYAILFGIISCFIYHKQVTKKQSETFWSKYIFTWRFVGSTLFIIYFFVLCNIVYFSREPGSRMGVDMRLFSTWGTTNQQHAYVIENVILFIPFGILFPACLPEKVSILTIFTGAICSVSIEYIQYRTGCGYCQLDDVVTNILGTIIGYIVFMVCHRRLYKNENFI